MPLWRKKIDAEQFGALLLWELAKYGKGAEAGLTELLESGDRRASVDQRLRDSGVNLVTRQRYQLFFTALMGQLAFHSLREKRLEKLMAGFEKEFPALNQEMSGVLDIAPTDLKETRHFSDLASDIVRKNKRFQTTGDLLNASKGIEGSLCEELGLLLLDKALEGSEPLAKGLQNKDQRLRCLRKMALTIVTAYDEGAMHYKQYKLI